MNLNEFYEYFRIDYVKYYICNLDLFDNIYIDDSNLVINKSLTQNNNYNDTISPNQNVEGADDDESQVYTEEELKRKAVVLSKLKTIKSKYVLKTKEYNIEKLEELHATVTRTMQSHYKSALSLEILLDILEAHANGL